MLYHSLLTYRDHPHSLTQNAHTHAHTHLQQLPTTYRGCTPLKEQMPQETNFVNSWCRAFFSSSLFSLYVIHKKGVLNPLSRRCISTYYEIKKVYLAVHLGSKQPY